MIAVKLIGNVWATRKADSLTGLKLMLAETLHGTDAGRQLIVVDFIGSGIGDRVIVTQGSSARKMCSNTDIPIDAVVVGIIDEDCKLNETV